MGKKKETFFERLTRKNAQQEDNTNPKPKKAKSWKFWFFSSLLAGSIVAGITIPLVANSLIRINVDPIKDDTVLFEFDVPGKDGKTTKIKFRTRDLKSSQIADEAKDSKKVLDQFYKLGIFYLYDQEVNASKEYQRLWNASRTENEKERDDIALKTVAELKEKHTNLLLDIKEQMIKTFGFSKWEQQFNDLLLKSFNGAKNIEEAASFKVYEDIQNDALRRFTLNTKFNEKDIDRVASSDIYKLDDKGNLTREIQFKQGQKVFPFFKKGSNYFELSSIKEKMTFMTNSYILNDKTKNADAFIQHYLKNNNPYLISQFTLPGVAPAKKEEGKETKWEVNKKAIKQLLFYWPIQDEVKAISSFDKVKESFRSYEDIAKDAKSTGETLDKKITEYGTILATLSQDDSDIKTNWGSTGLTSIGQLLQGGGDNTLKAFLDDKLVKAVYGTEQIKEIDLFGELQKIKKSIIDDADFKKDNKFKIDDIEQNNFNSKSKEDAQKEIAKFNKSLKKLFDEASDVKKEGLWADKFNQLIVAPLQKLFEDNEGKIQTVYKLKNDNGNNKDTFILLTTKGITLIKLQSLDKLKQNNETPEAAIKRMIQSDFELENKFKNTVKGKKYDALTLVNRSISSQELVIDSLLKDEEFKNYIKGQVNIFALDQDKKIVPNKKYEDKDLTSIKELNDSILSSNDIKTQLNLVKTVDQWMKDRAKNDYDANFELREDKVYFKHNNKDASKKEAYKNDASSIIFETLKDLRKAIK
ncbi:hypothetical protein E1I18_02185 [Mycoplasmopsis mucosicanis]|uniref:Membrane protein P80 n=1 Tax=Mycoplasmopsis mucosicanis TaxID=458208 RepID=A0A507SQQ7_9BACT|nr:hypothetical protein [Mycoplasmopsis mucosicanis]TQC51473.1 hypothetical protein E1I18_02185 [Mycoplasmopsis mucosicanis]